LPVIFFIFYSFLHDFISFLFFLLYLPFILLPYFLPYSFLYLTRYETNGFVAVTEKNNLRYEKVGQELRRKKVIYEIKSRNKFAKHIDLLDLIYANENKTKYNNQNDEKKIT